MKKIIYILLFVIANAEFAEGQDIHFSQFYNQPMLLNPALVASSDCNMQAGLNYRSQGKSFTVPYVTQSGFFEYKVVPKFMKLDWAGVGISVFQDEAGDGKLKTTFGALHAAYHKGLNYNNSMFASFGANIGFANKSVDYSSLLFENQWNGFKFSSEFPSLEAYSARSIKYFDFSAGSMFTYSPTINFSTHLGISLQHINRPKESFYYDFNKTLDRKYVIHGGINYRINPYLYLQPKFMVAVKQKSNEVIVGSNIIVLKQDIRIHFGLWTRFNRDAILLMGADFKRVAIFFSYDYNFSDLSILSQNNGGIEITLITLFESVRTRRARTSAKSQI